MTREEQISNGFTEMMKGFWGNQDLKKCRILKSLASKNLARIVSAESRQLMCYPMP